MKKRPVLTPVIPVRPPKEPSLIIIDDFESEVYPETPTHLETPASDGVDE